jgi:hypothetical protein
MAVEVLPGGQPHVAIDAERMAVAADGHLRVAAAVEELLDTVGDFVGNAGPQGLSDSDVFAGYLDLHAVHSMPL